MSDSPEKVNTGGSIADIKGKSVSFKTEETVIVDQMPAMTKPDRIKNLEKF
jgi:hypothetical protein